MTELWRPVVGYESDYLVSDQGNVWSLISNCMLKPHVVARRYWAVDLRGKKHKIHIIVAEAFICPRPKGLLCLHRDDDRTNNKLSNLYWGTFKQNSLDARRNNCRSDQSGAKASNAKLTEKQVREIRKLKGEGWTYDQICKLFPVAKRTIQDVVRRVSWANLA